MILRYLSQSDLQGLVGSDTLERLESFLPALEPEDYDPTHIYRKETLVKILLSFRGATLLSDRGNREILLNALPEEELDKLIDSTGVSVSSGQPFVDKVRKLLRNKWADEDFCKRFLEAGDLPLSLMPLQKSSLQFIETVDKAEAPLKLLKDYQYAVYQSSRKALDANLARFLVQMPTGSGKTRTAMEIICDFLNRGAGSRIVWLAHAEELCEQCIACFREVWSHVGTKRVELHRCWGNSPGLPDPSREPYFVVASFQKLHQLRKSNKVTESFRESTDLVIVDEAHKVLAPTYLEGVRSLLGNRARLFGLTATPGRSVEDRDENTRLAEVFFTEMIGIDGGNEGAIQMLKKRGILSRVDMRQVVGRTYELTDDQKRYMETRFDYPPGFLQMLADDDIRNIEIVKQLLSDVEREKQILFFACSVDHSRFICALLHYYGVRATHIDGGTDRAERRAMLQQFKDGEIQVLCNYGIVSTGFDAPKIDLVFISRPTHSIVLYSQMIGRGLRGPQLGGTERCEIVNVEDNILGLPPHESVYDYFAEYWD